MWYQVRIGDLLKQLVTAVLVLGASASSLATQQLGYKDLDDFIDGSTIMAAGGGGSPSISRKLLSNHFGVNDTVQLSAVGDIPDVSGQFAATIGAIGSPEALFGLDNPLLLVETAFLAMFAHNLPPGGSPQPDIGYLMPVEVGSVNGLYAFLLAASINQTAPAGDQVSVLDVDGGGRSVPTLPLLIYSNFPKTYAQYAVLTSPEAEPVYPPAAPQPTEWALLTAQAGDQGRIENTILAMLSGKDSPYAGAAGYGSFYAPVSAVKLNPPVTGQISLAVKVGAAYKQSPTGDAVVGALGAGQRTAKVLFTGKVTNMTEDTTGLDYGVVTIAGSGANAGDTFTIQYENENICAFKESYSKTSPFVLGPDTVAYVPADGTVLDNSDLLAAVKAGQQPAVTIVAIDTVDAVKNNPAMMASWSQVRAAIPNNACNFAYAQPWK